MSQENNPKPEISFHQKMVILQTKIKSSKNQFNKFGKYNYRKAEDIIASFKECNEENGLSLVLNIKDEVTMVGSRYYIKSTATLVDKRWGEESGAQSAQATALAREEDSAPGMSSAQLTGSTSSYARKYALCGLLGLDDEKDDDCRDNQEQTKELPKDEPKKESPKQSSPMTDNQGKAVYAISKKKNIEMPKLNSFEEAKAWIEKQNKG